MFRVYVCVCVRVHVRDGPGLACVCCGAIVKAQYTHFKLAATPEAPPPLPAAIAAAIAAVAMAGRLEAGAIPWQRGLVRGIG